MADQLHVSGVGELEHEIGAAKQRHETRRLLEQRREPFPLARGPPLGEHTLGRLDDDRDYARRFPVVARNRRIVEVHPHLLGPAVAMQGQLLVGIRQSPAGQPHLHHIIVEVGDLGPPLADLAAQKLRMPAPGKLRVSIVVDHDAVLAPQHDDRHGRAKQDSGRGFQALRPILDGAKRRVRPVEGRDQPPALAAAGKEGEVVVRGLFDIAQHPLPLTYAHSFEKLRTHPGAPNAWVAHKRSHRHRAWFRESRARRPPRRHIAARPSPGSSSEWPARPPEAGLPTAACRS